MWLHHAPYLLHATITIHSTDASPLQVHVYTLTVSTLNEGEATLHLQDRLNVATQCKQAPKILSFLQLCSGDDALLQPHLVVYDAALGQLECHRVEPSRQLSLVAHISLDLTCLQFCRVVSNTTIVIASRSSRRDRITGFDLFEWTPGQQRLLQGRLETNRIVGIAQSHCPNDSWDLFYEHPLKPHHILSTTGSSLMSGTLDPRASPISTHVDAIAPEYRSKLRRIYSSGKHHSPSDNETHDQIWAQTLSDELVFFRKGAVQWSTKLASTAMDFMTAECQVPDGIARLCLLVRTEKAAAHLYDAVTGRQLNVWSTKENEIILSDVRNMGVCSVLSFPNTYPQPSPIECLIFPASAPRPRSASPLSHARSVDEGNARAKANLEITLGTLRQQLELKRIRIKRLHASLASKAEILQDCQDLLEGPLRSVFVTAGGPRASSGSVTSQDEGEMVVFHRKREQRRRRILERLVPIVGNTIESDFLGKVIDAKDPDKDLENHTPHPVQVLESSAGWISFSSSFSEMSRGAVWFGVLVRNQSSLTVFNLRLSVAQQGVYGRKLSCLEPGRTGLLVGSVSVDVLSLTDDEYLDRSLAVKRILSDTARVHFEQIRVQQQRVRGTEEHTGYDTEMDLEHSTISVLSFKNPGHCSSTWRSPLAEVILPSGIGCRLDNITRPRLLVLLQDGLGLSSPSDGTVFGSLEEEVIATIASAPDQQPPDHYERSWHVVFRARTNSLALDRAKQATLLCSRFA